MFPLKSSVGAKILKSLLLLYTYHTYTLAHIFCLHFFVPFFHLKCDSSVERTRIKNCSLSYKTKLENIDNFLFGSRYKIMWNKSLNGKLKSQSKVYNLQLWGLWTSLIFWKFILANIIWILQRCCGLKQTSWKTFLAVFIKS